MSCYLEVILHVNSDIQEPLISVLPPGYSVIFQCNVFNACIFKGKIQEPWYEKLGIFSEHQALLCLRFFSHIFIAIYEVTIHYLLQKLHLFFPGKGILFFYLQ